MRQIIGKTNQLKYNVMRTTVLEVIAKLSSGGAERFVVDLCNEMSLKRPVTLVVLQKLDPTWFYVNEISDRVKVISLEKSVGFSFKTCIKLIRVIFKEKPMVVHTHLSALYYAFIAAFLFHWRIRFLHTLHNDAIPEAENKFGIWVRKILFYLKLVIPVTISEKSQESFNKLYRCKSVMIYNGRKISSVYDKELAAQWKQYKISANTTVLLNVASVQKSKNQLLLAKSVQWLINKGYDLTLLIIGRIVDTSIANQINDLGESRIFLLGERTNPRAYMTLADAFCLSSLYEGMPITLIEAFSVGLIPVCTPVGGINNMIADEKNGFLAQSLDEEDYVRVLEKFLNLDEEGKNKMKEEAKQSYQSYTMEKCLLNYENIMFCKNYATEKN